MRAVQGVRVSSTVTKRNPRPRKYASASERQAAYRARAPEVCFRAEPQTADKLDQIAADLDVSRADLLLSMTKFALTNHDWARFGLTHRPLPFEYGIETRKANPIMPTIYSVKSDYLLKDADEIERSANESLKAWTLLGQTEKYSEAMKVVRALRDAAETRSLYTRREILRNAGFSVKSPKQTAKDIQGQTRKANPMKKPTPAQLAARARFAEMARSGAFKRKAKRNPAKKTVSQKISQLVHEGYPQKQAVAVALSEQRKGKVKRNPAAKPGAYGVSWVSAMSGRPQTSTYTTKAAAIKDAKALYQEGARNIRAFKFSDSVGAVYFDWRLPTAVKLKRNPATGRKGSQTKLNPTGAKLYTVSRADANGQPVYHIAHFRKMADAKAYAQAYADANKTRVAITSKPL